MVGRILHILLIEIIPNLVRGSEYHVLALEIRCVDSNVPTLSLSFITLGFSPPCCSIRTSGSVVLALSTPGDLLDEPRSSNNEQDES